MGTFGGAAPPVLAAPFLHRPTGPLVPSSLFVRFLLHAKHVLRPKKFHAYPQVAHAQYCGAGLEASGGAAAGEAGPPKRSDEKYLAILTSAERECPWWLASSRRPPYGEVLIGAASRDDDLAETAKPWRARLRLGFREYG